MSRPPLPPFTLETALHKVRLTEDARNGSDPARFVDERHDAGGRCADSERLYQGPAGRRPDDHAGLTDLGL